MRNAAVNVQFMAAFPYKSTAAFPEGDAAVCRIRPMAVWVYFLMYFFPLRMYTPAAGRATRRPLRS